MHLILVFFTGLVLSAQVTLAAEAVPLAANPAVEARMIEITQDLRCLVCQNESLAASQADLAKDLRREVREQVEAGKTDAQIRDYLVARYGDFVLYRPPFKLTTLLLWLGPLIFLVIGGLALFFFLRRNDGAAAVNPTAAPLSIAERERAEQLLHGHS